MKIEGKTNIFLLFGLYFDEKVSILNLQMKAGFLTQPHHIDLQTIETPEPKAGEVRIKLSKVGICGSDVHLFLGHRILANPTVIGHEGLGIIDKIGDGVVGRHVGERVAVEPNIPCGKCRFCVSGRGNICSNKRVVGLLEAGCFAEYVVVPEAFARHVPADISEEDAVVLEPTAVAVHALFSTQSKPGDTIAVIGLGAIGLLVTHLALALGYRVFVSEINETKRTMAADMGAIPTVPQGSLEEQSVELSKIWAENEVCAVFECAGSAFTASLATTAAPRGSEIVLVGLSANLASFQPLKIAREGIHIVPSIIYDHPFDFQRAMQLIRAKVIRPGFIISSYADFDNLQAALELAAQGNESKIVVNI